MRKRQPEMKKPRQGESCQGFRVWDQTCSERTNEMNATTGVEITQPVPNVALEVTLMKAQAVNRLVSWIERARYLSELIEGVAGSSDEFRAMLTRYEVPYGNACWDAAESDGLCALAGLQSRLMDDALSLAGGRH